MSQPEDMNAIQDENLTFIERHRYLVLIALTLIVSFILVGVSLFMYQVSGTAQLDLSRPGYQSPADQTPIVETEVGDYSASGDINLSSIEEFKALYDEQATSATSVDAFSGDPLSPESLEYAVTTQ